MTDTPVSTPQTSAAHPQLAKTLRSRHVTMISIGGIIGAGLFVGSSAAIAAIGPAVLVSYALAGLIVLFVMRMLGEMAVTHPETGAFTEFSRLALGPLGGFTAGWLYWYFWVVVIAIEAIAGAAILARWIDLPPWQIGVALMTALTASNLFSTRTYGEFEFWFSSIKVAAIVAFIAVAGAHVAGLTGDHQGGFSNLISDGGFAPFGWGPVIAGVTTVIFAIVGAEIATVAAAEAREGPRVIANLTTTLVMRIVLFYVGAIGLILAVIPWRSIEPGSSPFSAALGQLGVPGAEDVMNIVVLVAVLSCLNSGIYVASRILFTLAAKGDAPGWIVKLDERGVPNRAILSCVAFAFAALGASVVSPGQVFAFLVNASGALMMIIYLMTVASHVRLRAITERTRPEALTLKAWFYPVGSYLAGAAMIAVLAAMALSKELATQLYASLACLGVTVVLHRLFRAGRNRP
ncbi:MAG: amino acid permease [Alphaproteobacteria bacterium]|nr:amino acid permease [Alphaproteobacteria bacterium]